MQRPVALRHPAIIGAFDAAAGFEIDDAIGLRVIKHQLGGGPSERPQHKPVHKKAFPDHIHNDLRRDRVDPASEFPVPPRTELPQNLPQPLQPKMIFAFF